MNSAAEIAIVFAISALTLVSVIALVFKIIAHRRSSHKSEQVKGAFDNLNQHIDDGLLLVSHDGYLLQHNLTAQQLLDRDSNDLSHRFIGEWLDNISELSSITCPDRQYGKSLNSSQMDLSFTRLTDNGAELLFLVRKLDLSDEIAGDVERFKRSQYFAQIGTWDWNVGTDILYWSEAIYGIFGFKVGEITPSYQFFYSRVHPEDRQKVRAGELRCIETGENHDEEYRVVWPDNSIHWVRETGNLVKDEKGEVVKMMGVVRDITQEKLQQHHLHRLAHHDALTGLPNRLMLEQHLLKSIQRARAQNTRVALVFIDLNGFKEINDTLGHKAGDQVLVACAKRLNALKQPSDLVARIGGDEFVMVVEGLFSENNLDQQANEICTRLSHHLSQPLNIMPTGINASLGIAVFPEHAANMDGLLHVADQAMYAAKARGDNQYQIGLDEQFEQTARQASVI
ncbi:diguanylate cyclase domain-containing protein [Shewanella psychrotolerans]|uniref:diguanylate cyclase domain-containing protein n=1 Tax=Shewanella psychrotolerans TaxID=2864206 RepID=UPI001C65ADD2|nr:diguanylate cyclase [Shewanella psychrotolerans]QYK00833.1 sensor domain-containing diguanylate cyclase [Shewanella psychrotolerans]